MGVFDGIRALLFGRVIARERDGADTITVVERGAKRVFLCNDVILSRLGRGLYTGAYWDYFTPLPALYKNARVLVIGLGGGTIPFQLETLYGDRMSMDVVEISETVARLSAKFLPRPLCSRIVMGDGIEFVKRLAPDSYDIMIVDPYRNYTLSAAFLDGSFIDAAYSALSDRGILAINYILDSSNAALWEGALSSFRGRFSMYSIGAPQHSGNRVVLRSKKLTGREISETVGADFPDRARAKQVVDGYSAMVELQ